MISVAVSTLDCESGSASSNLAFLPKIMPYKDKSVKKAFDQRRYQEIHDYIIVYLAEHPCVDCGNTDLRVLEFDHEEKKSFNIGRGNSQTLKRVKEEIEKCKVRCANCHKIRHWKERQK